MLPAMFDENAIFDSALFADRRDAGRALARTLLAEQVPKDSVVLALPRGGVPVAYEVASALHLPLDILAVRKLGAPGQEELAMGAIAAGGTLVVNPEVIRALGIPEDTLRAAALEERRQLEEDERVYRNGLARLEIAGRPVLLVDDGLATGATMRAAARAVRFLALQVIIAVPVAALATCRALAGEADRLIATATPDPFDAVGRFYANFAPIGDAEVITLLAQARRHQQGLPAA
jgi:putative phosphoribosyl transferase